MVAMHENAATPLKPRATHLLGTRGLSCILFILLALISAFALYMTGRAQPFLRSSRVRKPKSCILYDRPPRTGSATVSRALDECLTPRGWGGLRRYKGVPDHKLIPRMLDRKVKTALISRQVFLTRRTVSLIQSQCTRFVFITSARPMKHRLLSKLQMALRGKKDKKLLADGGNMTTTEFKKEVKKRAAPIRSTEKYYEKLPTLYGGTDITPNYVIRSTHFDRDLTQLLKALGCLAPFSHTKEDNITESFLPERLDALKLQFNDEKFHNLTKIAEERNAATLEIIATSLR